MAEPRIAPRPRQVTLLAGFSIVASLLLVVIAYDGLSVVASVDTQHQLQSWLQAGGTGVKLTVDQLTELLRLAVMATGALAAAAFVLAIFVLLRHNGARIGLTVVAALLLPSAYLAGFLPIALAVAAGMLWSPQVKEWFSPSPATAAPSTTVGRVDDSNPLPPDEGKNPPETGQSAPPPPPPASSPYGQAAPSSYPSTPEPAAYPSPGAAPAPQSMPPGMPPAPLPYGYGPPGYPSPGMNRPQRPGSVLAAAVITWISAGLAMIGWVMAIFGVLVARDRIVNQIESNAQVKSQLDTAGITVGSVVSIVLVLAVLMALWSLTAMILAFFVLRGANWARILLAISAVAAALFSLLSVLGALSAAAIVPLVYLIATVTALVLLFQPAANGYFRGRQNGQNLPVW